MNALPTFAQRAQHLKGSAIREILKMTEQADIISFAGGLPTPRCFPSEEFAQAYARLLKDQPAKALQYGSTEGYTPLREWVVQEYTRRGVPGLTLDHVLIVSGSQQALDLLGKLFLEPGSKVLLEHPSYLGAIQSFSLHSPQFSTIPMDGAGLMAETITEEQAQGARLCYVLPNFQNPTGVTMSLERRKMLVEKMAKANVPLIEDDPYGSLRYRGQALPSLLQLGQEAGSCVVHMGSFSKVMAPGLRIGYIIAPPALIQRLTILKQAADLHTSTINQMAMHEVLKTGFLPGHIQTLQSVYRTQCDYMLEALETYFPKSCRWNVPDGGMFLWVTMPESVNTVELLSRAIAEQQVAFVPGTPFYAGGQGPTNTLRLSFVTVDAPKIRTGIQRLSTLL